MLLFSTLPRLCLSWEELIHALTTVLAKEIDSFLKWTIDVQL
jgi:hypothetical protein